MPQDSELLQKKRELLEKKKAALEIQRSIMHEAEQAPSRLGALGTGVLQGTTYNLSDEIASLLEGGRAAQELPSPDPVRVPAALGGFGDKLITPEGTEAFDLGRRTSMAESELQRNEQRMAFPGTMMAGELLGGAATGGATFKAGNTALNQLPVIPRVLGIGATEGALFGAGAAEEGERGQGAALGAGLGAIGTPLGMGLGVSIGNVMRPVARRLGESLLGTPKDRAVKEIMGALDAEDITKDEAFTLIQQMGRNAILADVGDAPARLGRLVTSELGGPASRAKRQLDFRQIQSQNALKQAARRATGANSFDKGIIEVVNGAESKAAPIYKEVFSEVLDVNRSMLDLLERPALKAARRKAGTLLSNEGFATDIVDDITDVRYMDAIKRALDDDISVAVRAGNNNKSRVLTQLKRDFVKEIDAQVPQYAEARSLFAGEAAMKDAAELGRTIFKSNKTSVRDASELIGAMGESELQAARHGFLDYLSDELAGQSVKRNTLVNKFSDVPKFRQMTQLLFPSQQHVDDFLQAAATQSRFGQTRNFITGGSPTARIQSDQSALSPGIFETALTSAEPGGMLRSALRLIKGNTQLSPEVLEEMGNILFNPKIVPKDLSIGPVRLFDLPKGDPSTVTGAFGGLVGSQQDTVLDRMKSIGLIE